MQKELLNIFKRKDYGEQINIIHDTTKALKSNQKRYKKAQQSYLDYNGVNTGVRGGKNSTLFANMEKCHKVSEDLKEQLKELVNLL